MSQENVERILRGYAALNRGDLDGAVRRVSPDCEVELPPMLPEANTCQGRDGVKRMWAAWRDSFEDFRMEVEETIDGGDHVIVMASVCGKGKDSGAEVRTPTFPIIWTLQHGEAISLKALPTRAAALEAVGLSE
jgi:ketosteroid isomerase-like protein